MITEKRELEFNTAKFMADLRRKTNTQSLRDLADKVGTSASTLSRIDNGTIPDMQTFIMICSKQELSPGDYFEVVTWKRV